MSKIPSSERYVLSCSARSERGQVAAITALLDRHGAFIEEIAVFDDDTSGRFHVRCAFGLRGVAAEDVASLETQFAELTSSFDASIGALRNAGVSARVLLMVSKYDHCLRDLLERHKRGELDMEVVGVVSNHPDLGPFVLSQGLPFHHLPVSADTKPRQEARLLDLIEAQRVDLVVLARYMQVLSEDMCTRLSGRVINIHHSFLPGFKGAKPYHQAHGRGVKLIGATAHFATPDLDEGPIIEQAVERVDHAHSAVDLLNVGRHLECLVLARALHYVLAQRVFVCGRRTVVLR